MTVSGGPDVPPPHLSRAAFDFLDGGAGAEVTLRRNRAAFDRWSLSPRVCVDVSEVDLTVDVLGRRLTVPFFVAPSGSHRLFHPNAELESAAAARAAGVPYVTSTAASVSMEDVAEVAPDERWFQLYCFRDRGVVDDLVSRAGAAGYRALVVTVDAPVLGRRRRDIRNRFAVGPEIRWANLEPYGAAQLSAADDGSVVSRFFTDQMDASVTWADIERIAASTAMPVWVKGVLRADDACRARDSGAAGVYVSNHGGRQLDRVPAALDVLPDVVDAVGGDVDVAFDGGVRDAGDVVTAIALGASAVGLGRAPIHALAAGGGAALRQMFDDLRSELEDTLRLVGVPQLRSLDRSAVAPWPPTTSLWCGTEPCPTDRAEE